MDLKEFIKESLIAIIGGIADAQKEVQKNGGEINPPVDARENPTTTKPLMTTSKLPPSQRLYTSDPRTLINLVEFDVAVTTTEEKGSQGGAAAGIKVMAISASVGGGKQLSARSQEASRIKFSIPIALPATEQNQT